VDVRTKATGPRARTIAAGVTALAVLLLLLAPAPSAVAGTASPQRSVTLAEPVYQGDLTEAEGVLGDGGKAALGALQPGSGGWYWPIGTEDFKGWSGWLDRRGSYVHVAQDMPCSTGRAVYAIGAGTVFISRADAGGYGVGGAPGGCIIITHVTAAGTKFHALYGHVSSLRVKEGQRVAAGQLIARVNGCRHLHFSIHPGAKYRDGNPYAGHVPRSWADHGGFVDPVRFLKTNPRAASYKPPAVPRTEVLTQTAPFGYGAADGNAYWTEEGEAGSATWRLELATGERAAFAVGEVTPPLDTRRYDASLLEAPAVGFSVGDHLPVLTLGARHDTPAWGADAELAALLVSAAGAPLQGGILKLQRLSDDRWINVGLDVTGADGAATLLYRPSAATALRVVFAPPAAQPAGRDYLVVRSPSETLTPHVALTTPKVPTSIDQADLITAAGDLTPRHTAGDHTVQLAFQRRGEGGAWVPKVIVAAVNRVRTGSSVTRYVGHARLTPGSWRVQAVHPADEAHAETGSAWRAFTVE
jgi:murein DD-endopeptidase MepM/ murein hydrolase activator NlpD